MLIYYILIDKDINICIYYTNINTYTCLYGDLLNTICHLSNRGDNFVKKFVVPFISPHIVP